MKEVKVSDECATMIDWYRRDDWEGFRYECEDILDAVGGLNDMLDAGKDSSEVARFANDIHIATKRLLQYCRLIKALAYDGDNRRDGEVQVTQAE